MSELGRTFSKNSFSNSANDLPLDLADRKSTRLNSSHSQISYAVFCLKHRDERTASTLKLSAPWFERYRVIASIAWVCPSKPSIDAPISSAVSNANTA